MTVKKNEKASAMKRFSEVLIEYRHKNGDLTQEWLAKELGVSKSSIKAWETQRQLPKPATLAAICNKLDCSYDYLLTGMKQKKHDDNTVVLLTGLSEMASYVLRSNQEIKQSKKCTKESKGYFDRYADVVSAVATDRELNAALGDYLFSRKITLAYCSTSGAEPLDLEPQHLLVNGYEIDDAFMDASRLQKIKARLDEIRKEGDTD